MALVPTSISCCTGTAGLNHKVAVPANAEKTGLARGKGQNIKQFFHQSLVSCTTFA
jgi:hypothetical protein